jgi:hypothetical protein
MNIDEAMLYLNRTIADAERKRAAIQKLADICKDIDIELPRPVAAGLIDFDNLSHDKILLLMQRVTLGDWEKELNYIDKSRFDYTSGDFVPGVRIRMWSGEPPPNCKVVEEEVEVPATTMTVRKLVCL